jgi:hypothetical protein
MQPRSFACALFFAALSFCVSHEISAQQSQQKPLTRTFIAGTEERYQFTANIRVETHGISTEKIGEKTYATPYAHEANGQISWRATRKISTVTADGVASISESLDQFRAACDAPSASANTATELQKSIMDACENWQNFSQMNYKEEEFGLIRGLPSTTGDLTGPDSPLLSLWLRRAFRPSVILPRTPIHFGEHAAHKISNPSGIAANPEGEEWMEWLEGSTEPPAAILHVAQNLSWVDSPKKKNASTITDNPNQRQLFYADSLNTISLLDGSLLKASRSATRETKEVLEPVPGLPDAPIFGSKLTITVTIQRLP